MSSSFTMTFITLSCCMWTLSSCLPPSHPLPARPSYSKVITLLASVANWEFFCSLTKRRIWNRFLLNRSMTEAFTTLKRREKGTHLHTKRTVSKWMRGKRDIFILHKRIEEEKLVNKIKTTDISYIATVKRVRLLCFPIGANFYWTKKNLLLQCRCIHLKMGFRVVGHRCWLIL